MFFGSGAQISGTALLDVPHPGAESKGCYIESSPKCNMVRLSQIVALAPKSAGVSAWEIMVAVCERIDSWRKTLPQKMIR
jgi:hypothetical protein